MNCKSRAHSRTGRSLSRFMNRFDSAIDSLPMWLSYSVIVSVLFLYVRSIVVERRPHIEHQESEK